MARGLAPGANAPEHDLVHTPIELAAKIVQHFAPTGQVLDPARGKYAPFYKSLAEHTPNAIIDWCEITAGRDFFEWTEPVDWIITNPPWSKMRDFLRHGYKIADEIVYLATLTHFVTRARLREMKEAGFGLREFMYVDQPPPPWPSSGFQLAAVWLSRGWAGQVDIVDELCYGPVPNLTLTDLGL